MTQKRKLAIRITFDHKLKMSKKIVIKRKQTIDSGNGVHKGDPFLIRCATFAPNEYWSQAILNLAKGMCVDNSVRYQLGKLFDDTKSISLNIDAEIAAEEIISFLMTHTNLRSPDDHEDDDFENIEDALISSEKQPGQSWSTLLKKHKEQAIVRFILNEQRTKNLSQLESEKLHYILNFGFNLKYFHRDNVIVSDYEIVTIKCLQYDPVTKTYSIDHSMKKKDNRSVSRSAPKPKKNYNDVWRNIIEKTKNIQTTYDQEYEDELDDDDYSRSSN